ncbi:MAG: hypothetical protein JNJ56_13895, partial [Ignavibacteria bacterium]|nr:hypothetical protein [Ignavibacteria bacterium]
MKLLLKILLFIFIISSNISILTAQPITWQKIIGGPQDESGQFGIQTYDGDYIILNTKVAADGGPYLLNIDQYGNEMWNRIIDTLSTCKCIQQTNDSGFIVSGSKNNKGILIKTDRIGNVIWKKLYSINNRATAFTMLRVSESSNILVCGYTSFFPVKAFVMNLDPLGNIIWQSILNYGGDAFAEDLIINNDSNIYLTGDISVNSFSKTLIAKMDSQGIFFWFKSFGLEGEGDSQVGKSIVAESNRELFISGPFDHFFSAQAHFTKIDSSGNVIFQNVLSQTNNTNSMCRTINGKYGITGIWEDSSVNILFLLLNNTGEVVSRKVFNSNVDEIDGATSIVETSDNGFLITGFTTYIPNLSGSNRNIYIIKTDSNGNSPVSVKTISSEIPFAFNLYQNYPNPFNPNTKIKFDLQKSGNVKLEMFDILGRNISTLIDKKLQTGSYEVS